MWGAHPGTQGEAGWGGTGRSLFQTLAGGHGLLFSLCVELPSLLLSSQPAATEHAGLASHPRLPASSPCAWGSCLLMEDLKLKFAWGPHRH